MSNPIRKQIYARYESYKCYPQKYDYENAPKIQAPKLKKKKLKKKKNFLALFFALMLLGAYGYFACPYNYQKYFEPLILNRFLNRNITFDAKEYVSPTNSYLHNSFFLGEYQLTPKAEKSKEMSDIQILYEMADTKKKLLELAQNYSKLEPSIFVWEYSTGSGLEINSDSVYPSASIIKIPIACELIRLIEKSENTSNPISLTDKREFKEEFRTLGSGNLQYTKAGFYYSLDHLANIMIANSDNSATNMLLYEIGGIDGFNRAMRNLGLKITSMGAWLPDLEGNNITSAKEISRILYNIDNPNYINPKYKNILKEYLGNTKNVHLLKEKLPPDVMVLHKTGDIGTMLGDSGIIYANNGKKYIVSILTKRPHNDYSAKMFIQDASLLIFEDINKLP